MARTERLSGVAGASRGMGYGKCSGHPRLVGGGTQEVAGFSSGQLPAHLLPGKHPRGARNLSPPFSPRRAAGERKDNRSHGSGALC